MGAPIANDDTVRSLYWSGAASLFAGCFPDEHGITTNFRHDRQTGKSYEMEAF